MSYFKRIFSFALILIIIVSVSLLGFTPASASGTGAGLAEWALRAYNEGWEYVYGGASVGAVDCSGLIYSYCGGDRVGSAQLASATASGSVSAGVPRVHGLGLYQPGHVGVYVGDGMAVDARGDAWDVCYQSVYTKSWTTWFKLSAVSYPTNGWVKFNGNYYYYENGQYVVSCTKEIGGDTYSFSSSGKSDKTPSDLNAVANNNSSASATKATTAPTTATPTTEATQATTQPQVLQIGSSGNKVTKLQNRLAELGFYNGVVTGYFGEATEEAYKAFQAAAGVTVDGIAGKSDLRILYSSSAPTAVEEETEAPTEEVTEEPTEEVTEPVDDGIYVVGEEFEEIVNIQNRLFELGYFYEDSTGYFGDLTLEAVTVFQQVNGLEATGEVDEATYEAIFSADAIENPYYVEPTEETEPTDESTDYETVTSDDTTVNTITENGNTDVLSAEVLAIAEANIEAAQTVVMKANKVSHKALAYINNADAAVVSVAVAQQSNKNFMLWMLLVLGIVAIASGLTFTLNRRKNYECVHIKERHNRTQNQNIRYW